MEYVACPHCQTHNDVRQANEHGHIECQQCRQLMSVPVPPVPAPVRSAPASSRVVREGPPTAEPSDDTWKSSRRSESRPSRRESGFCCPFCGTNRRPFRVSQISQGGWITFAVLMAFCTPLFWIGLLIKEDKNQCSDCGVMLD